MLAALDIPMFGFSCLAFLALCVVLAVAVFVGFRSGEKGSTKLGGFAGCMIALGLVGVAVLMAVGTGLVMTLGAWDEAVRRGPVKSFEFRFGDGSRVESESLEELETVQEGVETSTERAPESDGEPSSSGNFEIVVVLREQSAADRVIDWVRENVETDLEIEWDTVETEDGKFPRITFSTQLSPREIARVREQLESDLGGMELPTSAKIELREPR